MKNKKLFALLMATIILPMAAHSQETKCNVIPIAKVWAGHSVGFALITQGDQQIAAYYDDNRQMTLAQRTLGSTTWKFKKLPSTVGWDSHNYIAMTLDRDNYLHVSGNMHVNPLVYFRSEKPLDIDSVEQVKSMTGLAEDKVTYPVFFKDAQGNLIFSYREGSSGNGINYYNIYSESSKTWKRLLDIPIFDGQGKCNAYASTPEIGPDGYFFIYYVWRDSPDCSTNHDLSYIRSKDLVNWETIDGKPLKLPITTKTSGVIVDPVPVKGGIINGGSRVGFTEKNDPIVSYHKYDEKGNTQLYLARFANGKWQIHQASNWDYRCEFSGGGSMPPIGINVGAFQVVDGKWAVTYSHVKYGGGLFEIDPNTYKLTGNKVSVKGPKLPSTITSPQTSYPEIGVRWAGDINKSTPNFTYRLRWETLGANRDRPRDKWPEPTQLSVIEIPKE